MSNRPRKTGDRLPLLPTGRKKTHQETTQNMDMKPEHLERSEYSKEQEDVEKREE
jgi:hypothetical protein